MKSISVSKNVIQLTRMRFVNAFLVRETDGFTLVDTTTGGGAEALIAAAERNGGQIHRIALTHGHGDHVGALDALAERLGASVPVLMPELDARIHAGEQIVHGKVPGAWPKLRSAPDVRLSDGDRVGSLQVVATPGHTPGHVAFLDTRDGALIAGDTFTAYGRLAVASHFYLRFPFAAMASWDRARVLESAVRPESEGQLQFYAPAQVTALKRAASTPLDVAIYTLGVEAGPRMSEIRALKVRNVDFEVGVIRFEDGYTTRGGHAGNKGRRVRPVPMTDNVRVALWPYCKDRPGGALVFEHDTKPGEPICGSNLYRRFVSAARRAGLPILRFHDLRHSFGTQAIRRVNIYELQRLMGHRHITTTERYLHYAPDPDLGARLTGLWDSDSDAPKVIALRKAG